MTTTIIGPETFNFLFFLFILIIGLDYTWSGYLVIRNRTQDIEKRKLLGLWIIQRFHITANKTKSFKTYVNFVYNYKNMGIMTFVGGLLIIFSSGIMLIEILFNKP